MKRNNKGFTLLELVISMAISLIIFGTITAFMGQSTRNYRRSNDEISLQLEAQLILNQLNELIMESNNVKFDIATNTLRMKQSDCVYVVTLNSVNHTLQFEKVLKGEVETGITELFGRYVEAFTIGDTGSGDNNFEIKVSFSLINNDITYIIENNVIKLRNKIKAMDDWS